MDLEYLIEARNQAVRSHAGERKADESPYAMTGAQKAAIVVGIASGVVDVVLALAYSAGMRCDGFFWVYVSVFVVCLVALVVFEIIDRARRKGLGDEIVRDRRSELAKIRRELACRGVAGTELLVSLRDEVDRFVQAREESVEKVADRAWSLLVTTVLAAALGLTFGLAKDGGFLKGALLLASMIVVVCLLTWAGVRGIARLVVESLRPRLSDARALREDLTALLLELDGRPGPDSDPGGGRECCSHPLCVDDGR